MKKKSILLTLVVISLTLAGSRPASMQQPRPTAKDMFVQRGSNNEQGRRGAKVAIQRLKSDGGIEEVSPDTTFYYRDQIRLVFNLNFAGYLAIVNQGPPDSQGNPGPRNLLFPYRAEGGGWVNNKVSPNSNLTIPSTGTTDWITFDDKPGQETVSVTFSATQISEMTMPATTSATVPAGNNNGGSINQAAPDQEQRLIQHLGKNFPNRSKDMFVQTAQDGLIYGVGLQSIDDSMAFSFTLTHEKGMRGQR